MRLLVTGSSGFIGSRFAVQALAGGHEVRTLTRRDWAGPPAVPRQCRHFGHLPFDVQQPVVEGVEVVVHCAASADPNLERCRAINVLGTRRLAESARAAGARAFVFLSSQNASPTASSPYGLSKYEAEQELLALRGLDIMILRPGLVLGRGGLFGRLLASIERLPIVPVIGREAPVQPIFVGDLVDAILRCARDAASLGRRPLCLGTSAPSTLGDLLSELARAIPERSVRLAPIPMRPLVTLVRLAERAHVPLPINSGNLAGLQSVRPMETDGDMRRLAVPDRTLADIVKLALADRIAEQGASLPAEEPTRTLLVGAGRVGLVHAVTISRQPGAVLSGVVDLSSGARRLLRSTGITAPDYANLHDALEQNDLDAVVIATPPTSHLSLARVCLGRGLATLIEKPASVSEEQLAEYDALVRVHKNTALVGYLMPRMPHIQQWLERIRRGELGKVRGFLGLTLLSLIQGAGSGRWETQKEVSGGGVVANSAGHVLSMIWSAFGDPSHVSAQSLRVVSHEVEDSVVVSLDYGSFRGTHLASWCIQGFPRQENRLVVWTERGVLTLTGSMALWLGLDESASLSHQLDNEVGFNLAPDYAGAGFACEVADLAGRSRADSMTLDKALAVERVLFSIYRGLRATTDFDLTDSGGSVAGIGGGTPPRRPRLVADVKVPASYPQPRRILDIRDVQPSSSTLMDVARSGEWADVLAYAGGASAASRAWTGRHTWVTVPNFLHQTRLITDRRYGALVGSFGPRGLLQASLAAATTAVQERNAGFWVAAAGLLAAELAQIPDQFDGQLLLHPYLVDLALALDRLDRLEVLLDDMRRAHPKAQVGMHSNLARLATNAAATMRHVPQVLSLLGSPNNGLVPEIRSWLAGSARTTSVELAVEVGPGPRTAHRMACDDPRLWSRGAEAIVISGLVEHRLFLEAERASREHWARAFRNWPLPKAIW